MAAVEKRKNEGNEGKTIVQEPMTFNQLSIHADLKSRILGKGFTHTTPIQHLAIPAGLEGKDIQGLAQTGTGKTVAFLVPIINKLMHNRDEQALILAPTRELAVQIEQEFKSLTKGLNLYSACFIGGTNLRKDLATLNRRQHVIIGTPGRLVDLLQRRALDLRRTQTLVLDEFDRMLDMGFTQDMDRLRNAMYARKQTLLFSATHDASQKQKIAEYLSNPVLIHASTDGDQPTGQIEQQFIRSNGQDGKLSMLTNMLQNEAFERVIIFSETKRQVSALCKKLQHQGIKADDIHGDKSQPARQRTINNFSSGKVRVLVATDVAARGIDVKDVTHVVNYRLPQTIDSYVHRIGRTGRAGKRGVAITLLDE